MNKQEILLMVEQNDFRCDEICNNNECPSCINLSNFSIITNPKCLEKEARLSKNKNITPDVIKNSLQISASFSKTLEK